MEPRIPFERAPAEVTIGDGLRIGARFWRVSFERWVLAVAAVALVNGLVLWLFRGSLLESGELTRLLRLSSTGAPLDPSEVPALLAGPLAISVVSTVAGWFLAANAIAGLRGRPVTIGWVLLAGLRAFVASLLIAMVVTFAVLLTLPLGVLGALFLLALLPVACYLAIRIGFWTFAIFDGSGIGAGLAASWALTHRAVLRAFGWSLALAAMSLGILLVGVAVDLLVPVVPLAAGITAALDTTFSAFSTIVLAVLYESQRGRQPGATRPEPVPRPEAPDRSPLDPPPPPGPPWG